MLHAYLCAGDFELFTSFPICDRNVPILAPTCLLQKFNAQKQLLLLYETILLQTLGFHLNVVYPYTVSTARRKWTHMASYLFYSRPFIDCERKALGWTQVCIRYFLCLSSLYNRFEVKVAIRVVCISLGVCVCGCTMCVHVCGLARVPTAYRAHRYSANNECIQCDVNSHMNPYFFCSFCLHSWRAYSSLGEAQILYTKLPICQRPLWTTGKLALPIRHHQCSLGEYAQTASFKKFLMCALFAEKNCRHRCLYGSYGPSAWLLLQMFYFWPLCLPFRRRDCWARRRWKRRQSTTKMCPGDNSFNWRVQT